MTVSLQTPSIEHEANGVTTAFAYPFKILDEDDLAVYLDGVEQTISTHYTVSGVGVNSGGMVTFVTAPAASVVVSIAREMRAERTTDYQTSGDFLAAVVNPDFDRAIMLVQDLVAQIGRAVRTPPSELSANMLLPAAVTRANKFLHFDNDGNAEVAEMLDGVVALSQSIIGTYLYPRSAAEIAAGVIPTNYFRDYGDLRRYGAVSGALDVTSAFAAAALVAATHPNYWPAGTWNLSGVKLTTGATVRTDGFSTSLVQIAGYDGSPNPLTRLVKIVGSDVTLGDLSVTGQIATDSSEFNHGVTVETEGADIRNVTIGDIKGTNIRGDVLYIGGLLTNTVSNIRYGRITGSNILRNIVSITTNASAISGISIEQTGAIGYATYDIEPDHGSPFDIHVGLVRGRRVQCAPSAAVDYADRISIGSIDLSPAYGGNSTPAYSAYEGDDGLVLRNTRHIYIGQARIRNYPAFAIEHIFNIGELADQRLHIGHLEISGCGASESTYNTPCFLLNMSHVQVDSGVIALQAPTADYAFYGNPTGGTSFDLSGIVCDGALVREANASTFQNIRINTTNATRAFQNVVNSTVCDSDITIPTLLTTGANVTFRCVDGTHSTAVLAGTCTDISFENCSGGLEGVSSPAQITAAQNDYAVGPAVTDLRLSTDASRNVTGITNGRKGRRMRVFNVGTFDLVLVNESASSTAANRFALGADLTIGAGEGATLWYDSASSRWRCASRV